ncbi:MAG: hypothetical protein VX133_10320 [Pseudomonadota bacterium]|nr:hypothetical protein [Pseudomonadota bacterium]
MKNKEEPKDLLAELEMLQRVLDNPTSSNAPDDDIPLLDDLFEVDIPTVNEPAGLDLSSIPTVSDIPTVTDIPKVTDIPTVNDVASEPSSLRPVPIASKAPVDTVAPTQESDTDSALGKLSPLNQILDKINRSQETEPAPIPSVATHSESKLSSKRAELDANMAETTASLTSLLQRERMVDELVEELMPMIKSRLRARVRDMLSGKEES